jgi:predicted MFS family arabinose efflux permease
MDRRLLVLSIGMFALGTDSFVVAGVLPEIARHFDVGIGAAGQMTTIYSVTFALLSPTIAAIAAGVSRKTITYFHIAMAYAILRHNGVDVGKQDFLRPINFIDG